MSGAEYANVARSIFKLADILQRFGNNYYKASAAWTAFPGQLYLLQAKHEDLEAQLERFGQSPRPSLLRALNEAKALMETEVVSLEKRKKGRAGGHCHIMLCFRRFGEMVFPEQVGLAIQTATQALDGIIEHLKEARANEEVFRSAAVARCDSMPFNNNDGTDCYVPLKRTESSIYSALKESTVVLIYGGPGKGKSTVARQMSLTLQKDKASFDHVFLLECGLGANAEAKQIDLLHSLGGDDLPAISGSQSNGEAGSKFVRQPFVEKQIRTFLKKQKVLIVLDDVWEPSFLQSFLELSGAGVKYIVASQRKDLCKDLNCKHVPLQIEDLDLIDARRILAVHVGFADQLIPDHLKEMSEKILSQAEGIPLVIAQLGAQIGKAEIDRVEVWESVADNFLQCLDEAPSKYIFGTVYPRSWWAAMKQSYDSLSHEAKKLLGLLGMCKGPAVPESVVQFLYSNTFSAEGCTKYQFSQKKTELKSRQLLFEKEEKWLSLHPLSKKFILDKMNDLVDSIASCFYRGNCHVQHQTFQTRKNKDKVTVVLLCLYLDQDFGQKVVLQTGQSLNTFSDLKKTTIEPIIQLLVPEAMSGNSYMGAGLLTSAMQVLLEFICNDTLVHDKISELLGDAFWMLPTLKFLEKLHFLDESFWQTNTLRSFFWRFVQIFQEHADSDLLIQARWTLVKLCECRDHGFNDIISTPEMFHQLAELLCQVQNSHLKHAAAGALATLAYGRQNGRITCISKIVGLPNVLDTLVQYTAKDQDFVLQSEAARALRNLADTEDTGILDEMANFPNLLHKLNELLTRGSNPILQEHAAAALVGLGWGKEVERKKKILNLPGLFESLVQITGRDQNFDLERQAALALGNLTSAWDTPFLDDLFCRVGKSLMTNHDHSLQEQTATFLAFFIWRSDDALRRKIIDFPKLLEKLVHSVRQDYNLQLQVGALRALRNLSYTTDTSIPYKLINFPGLLHELGESLVKENNRPLQEHAAGTIANLGYPEDDILKRKIVDFPELLEKLTHSVAQGHNVRLQEWAVRALQNLARARDPRITDKMVNSPNLLYRLGESLMNENSFPLQEYAAGAIAHLAKRSKDALRSKIVECPELLEKLVHSLAKDNNLRLQEFAVRALQRLALAEDVSILYKIVNFPHFLHRLGEALTKKNNPLLQEHAVRTITNLGWRGDDALRRKIIDSPELLKQLVHCRAQNHNLRLQEWAISAIRNLGIATDEVCARELENRSR